MAVASLVVAIIAAGPIVSVLAENSTLEVGGGRTSATALIARNNGRGPVNVSGDSMRMPST